MEQTYIVVACPHCELNILIFTNDIHCGVFRHGSSLVSGSLVDLPPHASREFVESIKNQGSLFGCGNPFRINSKGEAESCDWQS